jgi:hypothetical protein
MLTPDLIVSRHPATVEYLRSIYGTEVPVLSQANWAHVRGKVVAGNLPLHLAAEARAVIAVEFTGEPPRGAEYALANMIAAGVRLSMYGVSRSDDGDIRSLPCLTLHQAHQGGYC